MNDWKNSGTQSSPSAKPKIGLLRLVIFAFIAFWLFSKVFKPQAGVNDPAIPSDGSAQTESQGSTRNLPRYDQPLPSRDSKRNEVDSESNLPANVPRRSASGSNNQSDWSIEEVETKKSPSNADNETRFDPRGNANQQGKPTKTTKGDWSIEEVETKN